MVVEPDDLGVHTGFSIHERSKDEPRIDANPHVQDVIDDLRAGEYDYLVAWDDTRLARDAYYHEISGAAKSGECEMVFVEDIDTDGLAFGVKREVEKHVKIEEIRKSKQAKRRREKWGCYDGPAPTGLRYDDRREYLVKDPAEWPSVERVLEIRDVGASYSEIVEETGVSRGTVARILDRREWYEWLDRDDCVVIAKDGPACPVSIGLLAE